MNPLLEIVDHRPWPLPATPWIMHQRWDDFLFLHWRVPVDALRPLVPEPLELDLRDGHAWVGVIPFRMNNTRPRGTFNVPGVSNFLELNVRTYVKYGAFRGVWFLSLDADTRLAVELARTTWGLPYMHADMSFSRTDRRVEFHSERRDERGPPARFDGSYVPGDAELVVPEDSLERWLCERYALFTVGRRGQVSMTDVHHAPWPLRRVVSLDLDHQSMAASHGLDVPTTPDHVMWSPGVPTLVWAPRRIQEA